MRILNLALGLLLATFAILPSASATTCEQDPRGVYRCEADAAGYVAAGASVDLRTTDVGAEGYYCVDTHSHPGVEECRYWMTA